jgi:hypothetical protein
VLPLIDGGHVIIGGWVSEINYCYFDFKTVLKLHCTKKVLFMTQLCIIISGLIRNILSAKKLPIWHSADDGAWLSLELTENKIYLFFKWYLCPFFIHVVFRFWLVTTQAAFKKMSKIFTLPVY